RPVDAGLLVLAYFLGNLGMKAVTTPTLRRFGFRRVLVVNGLIASLAVMACAAISPETPQALVVALMLVAGLARSMQFAAQRSSAATLSSMLQQISMLFGVAVAAAVLNLSQIARGGAALDLVDFRIAFLVVGGIGLAAAFRFLVLPPAAGAEVSGHSPRN
ncbi:MAG: MFS transporter, partial [Mesorhizobium sp.]